MVISEAQKRATMKYMKKKYDRLEIKVPKGHKKMIQDHAQRRGKSINGFVNEAVNEQIERDRREAAIAAGQSANDCIRATLNEAVQSVTEKPIRGGKAMTSQCTIDSPIGKLIIQTDGEAVTGLLFASRVMPENERTDDTPILRAAAQQLSEYFSGVRQEFDLPLNPKGTNFQKKVWEALRTIPYGETRSYGQIAAQAGNAKAARAVGMANNRNPISVIIPCHRVIGANGALVGYGGGLDQKKRLLELEGRGHVL